MKQVELRDCLSSEGPLLPGHPSAEAGPGGLELPRDPAGVPWAAEFHCAPQAQGEAVGHQDVGGGSRSSNRAGPGLLSGLGRSP